MGSLLLLRTPFHPRRHPTQLPLRGCTTSGGHCSHHLWLCHAWPGMEQTSVNVCLDSPQAKSIARTRPRVENKTFWQKQPACSQLSECTPEQACSCFYLARVPSPLARTSSPLVLALNVLSSHPLKLTSMGFSPEEPESSNNTSLEDSSPPPVHFFNKY